MKAGLTRAEVRALVGTPGSVLDCRYATALSPRICSTRHYGDRECWQYTRPYQLTVCFGPSGRAASVGRYMGFTPRREALSAQLAATRKRVAPRFERAPLPLRGLMTRQEVVAAIGLPDEVFRKNPRAECWAYTGPYSVRLCFGAKRRLAWWSVSIPRETD